MTFGICYGFKYNGKYVLYSAFGHCFETFPMAWYPYAKTRMSELFQKYTYEHVCAQLNCILSNDSPLIEGDVQIQTNRGFLSIKENQRLNICKRREDIPHIYKEIDDLTNFSSINYNIQLFEDIIMSNSHNDNYCGTFFDNFTYEQLMDDNYFRHLYLTSNFKFANAYNAIVIIDLDTQMFEFHTNIYYNNYNINCNIDLTNSQIVKNASEPIQFWRTIGKKFACSDLKQELMQKMWHPSNLQKMNENGHELFEDCVP